MNISEINAYILASATEDELKSIRQAVGFRQENIKIRTLNTLRVGQKIRFNDLIRPKYMKGETATIVKVNRVKVVVDLDKPCGRFSKGITCPVSLIETI